MSDASDPTPDTPETPDSSSAQRRAADQVSIARRRALLKGLGKGAALAGAAAPLSSLAGAKEMMRLTKTDGKNYVCTASGSMSVMHSGMTANQPVCSGKHHSYYKSTNGSRPTWPKNGKNTPVCKFGTIDRYATDSFYDCFGSGPTSQIGWLVDNPTGSNEPYAYWVAAVLNANVIPSFPYTSTEVVNLYKNIGGTQSAALTFFKSYLST